MNIIRKYVWTSIIGVLIMASTVFAQAQTAPEQDRPWSVNFDLGTKPTFDLPAIGTANGTLVNATREGNSLWAVSVAVKPIDHIGGEVRYKKMAPHGGVSGAVVGSLSLVGGDITPDIRSSAGVLMGSQNYMALSSVNFSQTDILANWTFGFPRGAITLGGGVSKAVIDTSADKSILQNARLLSILPTGKVDTNVIDETYTFSSTAANHLDVWGPSIEADGEVCVVKHSAHRLILMGRGSLTFLKWGGNNASGQVGYIKDIFLVNTVTGVTSRVGLPLNLASKVNQDGFYDGSKATGTTADMKVTVAYRFHAQVATFEVGFGLMELSFNTVQPTYVVPGPYAAGAGKYVMTSGTFAAHSPMLTFGVRW